MKALFDNNLGDIIIIKIHRSLSTEYWDATVIINKSGIFKKGLRAGFSKANCTLLTDPNELLKEIL